MYARSMHFEGFEHSKKCYGNNRQHADVPDRKQQCTDPVTVRSANLSTQQHLGVLFLSKTVHVICVEWQRHQPCASINDLK